MKMVRMIGAAVRLPWRVLVFIHFGVKKVLQSAYFWIPFLFAVIGLLVAYYALANRYTPFTNDAYVQAFVVQVAPRVSGQVVQVYVQEDQLVEKDALLFEIDPRPFEHEVRRLEALLAQTIQLVAQMESELQAARADEVRTAADEALARAIHEQETRIYEKDATTERKFIDAREKYGAARALRDRARALVRQKEEALRAKIGDEHAQVAEVRARLASARLDLDWTKVRAPARGYVTNVQLRVGSNVTVGRPVLTCIDAEQWWVVVNYRENNLEDLRPHQPVGIAFKAYPGRIFPGTVQTVGRGVGEGQGVPSGELPAIKGPREWIPQAQRFQVRVALDDPDAVPLRVGATASVTAYTTPDFPLTPVAEFRHRLESWLYYLR
jgi:multidrug resistance efflux pump